MSGHRTRRTALSTGLLLGLMAGPAAAQVDETPEGGAQPIRLEAVLDVARSAAERAESMAELVAVEADDLAGPEEEDAERERDRDEFNKARGALASRVEQWELHGEAGGGPAQEVLSALLAGESPARIGSAHGKATAAAAAAERQGRKELRDSRKANGNSGQGNSGNGNSGQGNSGNGNSGQGNGDGDEATDESQDVAADGEGADDNE